MVGLTLVGSLASRVMGDAMSLYRRKFPHTVRVETTNHCQADCTFCPRESIGRGKLFMKQEIFESVVKQCAAGGCKIMHLHGFGEPLLDKQLPERIRLCKQSGIGRVKIFTNGGLLRDDMAHRLLDSGVDEIKISIDGADAKEFNQLRIGLDYDKVMENVKTFRALRDGKGMAKPTLVAATCQTSNREQTEAMLKNVVDRIDFTHIHNWGGALGMFSGQRLRKPCDRLWRTFTVLANGDVALCCLDYSGKEILGNVERETIATIWNNQRYRELRRLHRDSRQDEISLCKNCSKCFF
ncbi:MAG TPA: radical SAM/SPASM domain-containing protein [Pirellulales bacterium]|jgi:radical SAM protein with 4Fe4S-binding SPASM domain